jgi:hypothetical protein
MSFQKKKLNEDQVQQRKRALKVSTVHGNIDDLDGNVRKYFPEEETKKRSREDGEKSYALCVASPLDRKHILPKMSSLAFDGSTPSAKKKRRRLSHIGSHNFLVFHK